VGASSTTQSSDRNFQITAIKQNVHRIYKKCWIIKNVCQENSLRYQSALQRILSANWKTFITFKAIMLIYR